MYLCYLSPAKEYSAAAICNVSRIMQPRFPFSNFSASKKMIIVLIKA